MKRNYLLSKRFIILLCIVVTAMTGCGRNKAESTDTVVTENQETENSNDTAGSLDKNNEDENSEVSPETALGTTEVDETQNQEELLRSVTIYYVDDLSAVVVGQKTEIRDEYDIWAALINYGILTDECHLLSLNVNEREQTLDLDFDMETANRINSMGTTGETEIVGCIVNTYLEAYDCIGIKLTVEGQDFVTSHGAEFDDYPGRIDFE